jgi:hypothetical protein
MSKHTPRARVSPAFVSSVSSASPGPRGALSRRQFLQRATVAGAAASAPLIIPASVLGRNGAVPPSEKIILGGIGIGGRGSGVLNWMMGEPDVVFVATCDPNRQRREATKKMVDNKYGNNDCQVYSNTNEFLAARPDIDAVLSTTGDRLHAYMAVLAMRAGKDIYSEKPSSMTIAEGQAVVETARRYGRVYQTGTQRLSEANFVFCYEAAQNGLIGKVHTAHAHIAPWDAAAMRHDWLPAEPEPPKSEMDWDQWLGPCPWRPYNSAYVRGGWRGFYDFHTSCIGEWGAHTFAQAQRGLDLLDTSPVEYKYVDNPTGEGMETIFANGAKMILHREGWFHGSCAMRFVGTEGWVEAGDGYSRPDVSDPKLLAHFDKVVKDYIARTGRPMSHVRDFFNCIKSRQPTVANPTVMHRSMSTVHAANICMWLKRDLKFDPVKEEFVNDAEANRLRSRAMREPWIF